MINNLPNKYKENLIGKIKRFFIKLFDKNEKVEVKKITNNEIVQENVFLQMGKESKKVHLEEDIFNMIRYNPELLNTLTISQLKEINEIYDKKINEKQKKVNKLKRTLV